MTQNLVVRFAALAFGVIIFAAGTVAMRADGNVDGMVKIFSDSPKFVAVTVGVHIPTRDGTALYATIYKPRDQTSPLPVVFTFTPYVADSYHKRGMYFAQHGYVFATVDVRGRGNSEGAFEPFVHEAKDGADVVEWLARQPWSNGKVAMWGGSYAGMDQWQVASQLPQHLATVVPRASAHCGVDFPLFNNIFSPYDIQWLTETTEKTVQDNLYLDDSVWIGAFREVYLTHRPFRDLAAIAGNTETVFQTWLQHPTLDAYWDQCGVAEDQYRKIDIPVMTITGDYDADQIGALSYYRDFERVATPEQRTKHYLVIGPWDHAGTGAPMLDVGGLHFGAPSLLDMDDFHRQWFDWTMKAGHKPSFLQKHVAYYVAGLEQWRYADSLDVIGTHHEKFYLSSSGHANDVFHGGYLNVDRGSSASSDRFVYDPLDTRPEHFERASIPNSITDDRYALNLFGNGLVYYTDPFARDRVIAGDVRLNLWLSMDVRDTDLSASLNEILPDGGSISLTSDVMRTRYRDSLREASLVEPGKINEYRFHTFMWFARRIQQGSRLRLVISCPNSIYLAHNYNSGGVVANESGKDARTAHITVYHDARHPSAIEIPFDR